MSVLNRKQVAQRRSDKEGKQASLFTVLEQDQRRKKTVEHEAKQRALLKSGTSEQPLAVRYRGQTASLLARLEQDQLLKPGLTYRVCDIDFKAPQE
jgi:hypothetical protein